MSRSLFAAGLALLLASAVAVRADDADKPKDKDPPKEKLTPDGELTAKLAAIDTDKQTLTLGAGRTALVLDIGADAKVRQLKLPLAFDDKGNPRKYTPEELRDLKGTEGLPGYTADFTDLKPGQIVRVSKSKRKKTAEEIRDAAKAGDPIREVATLIVIEARPGE